MPETMPMLENKKTQVDGTKKQHMTEVSDLKAQLKHQKVESKDELKAELHVKSEEQVKLHHLVKFYEKEQKVDEAEIHKLQAAYTKEKISLSSSRLIYATASRIIVIVRRNRCTTKVERSLRRDPSVIIVCNGFTANVIIDKTIHFIH
jgi:hypothetical protein